MDFVRYAERSADLLNAELDDAERLRDLLRDRAWLIGSVTDRDAAALRRFQRELRVVFETAGSGDEEAVVEQLNALLAKHPVTPYISGPKENWHLHAAHRSSSVAELVVAESLLGLAILACDLGPLRLGVCHDSRCDNVFVDTSPNQSRRYCSDRCSSRANVAAYRARQKAQADAARRPAREGAPA